MTRSNVLGKGLLSHVFTLDQAHEPAVILEIILLYLVFIHFLLVQTEVELGMQPLAALVVGEGSTPCLVHFPNSPTSATSKQWLELHMEIAFCSTNTPRQKLTSFIVIFPKMIILYF